MYTRSTAQLAQDFPVASTASLLVTIPLFDSLVKQGFLGSWQELNQIIAEIGAAMAPLAEAYGGPTAVYTGAAGAVTRYYAVVPRYPLPYPYGSASLPSGNYLLSVPGTPPWGWPAASAAGLGGEGGVKVLWGIPGAKTTVAATATPLTTANYVTITAPAAKYITGTTFDIIASIVSANGPYTLVANGVLPGAVFVDNGNATLPANTNYGLVYTPRAVAEVTYDPNYPVGAATGHGTIIYGPLTRLGTL